MTNPDAQFRRRAIDTMASHADTVNQRLDRTEATVARIADAVEAQAVTISNLSANAERLERAVTGLAGDMRQLTSNVTLMIEESRSQRQVMDSLIKLCTALVERRAS